MRHPRWAARRPSARQRAEGKAKGPSPAAAPAPAVPSIQVLEPRLFMCVAREDPAGLLALEGGAGAAPVATAAAEPTLVMAGPAAAAALASPALSSRPAARAKLFLDFDGDVTTKWGSYAPGTTPAFDQDGDASSFSAAELASVRDVWARVAEKFSPFDLDVTTVDPGTLANYQALRVVIGGSGGWMGGGGGVAYVGSFANSAPNTAYVFSGALGGNPKYVAEAAAHEAGHAFGLQHEGVWSGSTLVNEYNPGTSAVAPIMGNSYAAARGLWWHGTPAGSATARQDELALLAGATNGFGYRADDVGDAPAAAAPLAASALTLSGGGVIERTDDVDVYRFETGPGRVSLSAMPVSGGMLDVRLDLRDAAGTVVASADAALAETMAADLAGGTYYLSVASHGGYGDVGQYTISGTAAPAGLAAPSALRAAFADGAVHLSWTDRSEGKVGFALQRSRDGGVTWIDRATLPAGTTEFADAAVRPGSTYTYRVRSFKTGLPGLASAWSNVAAMVVPTSPLGAFPQVTYGSSGWHQFLGGMATATPITGFSGGSSARTLSAAKRVWPLISVLGPTPPQPLAAAFSAQPIEATSA